MYNECRHIFTSGKKCQSPALKDQSFCYFHSNTRKRPARKDEAYEPYIAPQDTAHNLPPLEDADAIQLALSDVVLALAANRIDPRRARILIYGLQVASQNHRHRTDAAANEEALAQTVREIHEHADGTLIGPTKESPDPEEIEEQRRPPSLGEILLREAEAMKAQAEAERQAQALQAADMSRVPGIVNIHAVADTPIAKSCRRVAGRKRRTQETAPVRWRISPLKSSTSPLAEVFCSAPDCLVPSKLDACARQGQPYSSSAPHLFVSRPFAKSREDCFVRTRQVSIHLRVGD